MVRATSYLHTANQPLNWLKLQLGLRFYVIAAAIFSAIGCQPINATSGMERKAILINPSVASIEAITTVVSKALNGTDISLSENVFKENHRLVLHRAPYFSIDQPYLDGRIIELGETYQFSLYKQNHGCYLRYDRSGRKYRLDPIVRCKAM